MDRLREAICHLLSIRAIKSQKDLANKMRSSEATLSRALKDGASEKYLRRFNAAFGNIFNYSWLLTGEGNMLADQPQQGSNIIQGNYNHNISQVNGVGMVADSIRRERRQQNETIFEVCSECGEIESVPLIPTCLAQSADEDVWAYINQHKVPRTPIIRQFPNYDITYQVHSDAMLPRLKDGDFVALRYIGRHPKIFNGEVYCIDTKDTGFVIREVTNTPEGYRLHARAERYADDYLTYDEVVGVYEVVGMLGFTI